jgi:hypothetical protein
LCRAVNGGRGAGADPNFVGLGWTQCQMAISSFFSDNIVGAAVYAYPGTHFQLSKDAAACL